MNNKNVILIILDGFGISPITEGNAVFNAKKPFFDNLLELYPHYLLAASGAEVGLDWGEMGNSEVGHFNLGTGRVILQDFSRINRSIENKSFFNNQALKEQINHVKKNHSTLHLLGLLSNGGVHSHIDHLKALLDFTAQEKISRLALHLFTDGRDTAPKVAPHLLNIVQEKINKLAKKDWKIASLIGRFYAMDRDKHWERTKQAYDLITQGKGKKFSSYQEALEDAYQQKCFDEQLWPVILEPDYLISDNDGVVYFNFRQDRSRQIVQSLIDPEFNGFPRTKVLQNLFFTGFVNFGEEPTPRVNIAFFPAQQKNQLVSLLAQKKRHHLHIAETEKYAHVTYFFNGGQESPFAGEERILVPSPRVDSYAKEPQMSAQKITEKFLNYYKNHQPNFTVLNFANPDMVGHTGDFKATVRAIEIVDQCLGRILTQLSPLTSQVLITADHGNAEQMINPETKEIDKEHTTNPVPFILLEDLQKIPLLKALKANKDKEIELAAKQTIGVLADVTATILDILEFKKPSEMTGTSLRKTI